MGYAVAEAAYDAGAEVTLISGPVGIAPPHGVQLVKVGTAREMEAAVREAVQGADALVMAAAVADYAPGQVAGQKIKKTGTRSICRCSATPISWATLRAWTCRASCEYDFAAETEHLVENAREKLEKKRLDMIVANDAASSIGSDSSVLTFIGPGGIVETLPPLPKEASARRIIERVAELCQRD